ncbi:MAG: NapC/NirT family cytochrome c, partial [Vicinamibacterales bacterium]
MFKRWLSDVLGNPLSIVGVTITTMAAGLFLFVFFADLFGIHTNPYLGMVFFLVVPTLFLIGLAFIPVGIIRERRRRRLAPDAPAFEWPHLDLRNQRTRHVTALVVALTCVNVLIVSLAGYKGLEYMDSVAFCGQLCHEVMEPEFVAYQNGPHSRVKCVDCHIGEGADWFVRSKLSGTRQIFAVMLNTHERPVPTPVRNLRPARETCEQCHWPDKFHGDKIEVVREYGEDEANTLSETTLRLHVGGRSEGGRVTGIHWHTAATNEIEYVAVDERREQIPYVKLTDR